ncbi:MAG: exo-beta-N-acetylmuramidase NamZ family protein [Thermoanaerobaculia bacterium]
MAKVKVGLDRLLENPDPIRGKRIGLVANQSSVTGDLRHAVPLLHRGDWTLSALFGPEHGIWGEAQDMAHVEHSTDPVTGLEVHSLYGATEAQLTPARESLSAIDVLLVDLQDVGSRYYTFIYTMALCMRAAGEAGVRVVVLDRPNPIGGVQIEGNMLEDRYRSFVGLFPLPTRHGMTAGELARYFNARFDLGCDLEVVELEGWTRSMWFDGTGLPWVIPSPNMPTVATAAVYPGMCLIEGTNLSEGRGTTKPFELFGAPWLDAFRFADALNAVDLPGVRFRPHYFLPTFQKHAGKTCGGVQLHVTDREQFEPYRTGLWCIKVARDLDPEKFDWRRETYEYVSDRLAIDLLTGSSGFRETIEKGGTPDDWIALWANDAKSFAGEREEFLLY